VADHHADAAVVQVFRVIGVVKGLLKDASWKADLVRRRTIESVYNRRSTNPPV